MMHCTTLAPATQLRLFKLSDLAFCACSIYYVQNHHHRRKGPTAVIIGGIIKVLSVRQPWAWAIFCAGKGVESRLWCPHAPALLLICGAKRVDPAGAFLRARGIDLPSEAAAGGCIVGRVYVAGFVRGSPGAIPGHWRWLLAGPVPADPPVPCCGLPRQFGSPPGWEASFAEEVVRLAGVMT
jgi:hypothetical protein